MERMEQARVSAIICTRNRPDTIKQAVQSVLANTYPAFDLTVVDQSTSDATEALLTPLVEMDCRLHYLRMQTAGLSRAYNCGIRRSSGEMLAFTDDDCIVPRDWIATVVRTFAGDGKVDLLYGQVLAPRSTNRTTGVTPVLVIRKSERLSRQDGFKVFGMGANFAARRRLFTRIGGFDELLGGGAPLRSSQDYDLAYRAYCVGSVILLCPELRVTHYATRPKEAWATTLEAYGIGDGAFYCKHVRCFDLFALWLLTRQVVNRGGRELTKRVFRRGPTELTYVRSMLTGVRESFRFGVDRRTRLYTSR